MGSVTYEFSLSPASPSVHPSPHSEFLLRQPRASPDLDSRFPPSTFAGSGARSIEFTTAGRPIRRFKIGDMVWGAVKSHPWWPGQIFDEACALPIVRRSKVDGHVLVAFFGDSSYGWLDPSDVLPFEPRFPELSKQEGSPSFANAVVDAVDEVNRRAALGFVCRCRIPFHPTRVPGYVTVVVPGYEPGNYSMVQIEEARESIQPSEVFSIVNELAITPRRKEVVSVDRIRRKAMLLAYRREVFEEVDQAYDEAFGRKTVQSKILNIRDGGADPSSKKKKGRPHNLRDVPPASSDDTNLRISDLLASSRRRQQPEGVSTTLPASFAARPVDGQVSASPASSSVSTLCPDSSDVSTSKLQADLHPSNVYKPEPLSEPEPSSVLKPELDPSSVLMLPPTVMVTNQSADEVRMAKKMQVSKRPLENLNPKMKNTVKKLKRETPPPEPKPLDVSSDHSEGRHPSPSLNTNTAIPPRVSKFHLSQALSDLRSVAIHVFFEDDRNTPKIVKRVFGKFRSMVYRKRKPDQLPVSDVHSPIVTSVVDPTIADQPSIGDVHPPRIAESKPSLVPPQDLAKTVDPPRIAESKPSLVPPEALAKVVDPPRIAESKPSLVPPQALAKPVDHVIVGRKRAYSDQLEEMSAKRIKRSEKLKELPKKKPKSAVKTPMAVAKPEQQFNSGSKKDVVSAAASLESIQQLDSGSEKDADSAVVSLRPNQQLHSEIREVMDSAVAKLKVLPELDSASKKDVDSAMASAKPLQHLDSGMNDIDSTVAEQKADQQLNSGAKKDLGPAVAELKVGQQLGLGVKKDLGPAVAELKVSQQIGSGVKRDLGPVAELKTNKQLGLGVKKDVAPAVAKRKPNQQLGSEAKKSVESAVPKRNPNQQLNSRTKKDVGSAVIELKLNQQLDSGTEKDGSAVATLLDSGNKKDVSQAVVSLKPNQQFDTAMKNDVGPIVLAPQLHSSSTKNVDSAVVEPKLNLHLNSGTTKELDSAVAELEPDQLESDQQVNSGMKTEVGSVVAEVKPNPHLNSGTKKELNSAVAELEPNQQLNSGKKTEVGSVVAEVKPNPQPNSASKKPATPTYLIMKFPSDAVLPKVPYLNMRFSRLGKINDSSTGVNLKTNSCRVLFKSRSDAELAFKYVDGRQFFGEVKVEYNLRDVGPRPKKVAQEVVKAEHTAVTGVALPARSTAPIGDAALPTRQPAEISEKVVDKAWTRKSVVVKEPLLARQPTELPSKLHVEKDANNVGGTTESAAVRNVAMAVRPTELPPKPCIKKAVDKSLATKEVRFSVGGGDSMSEPPVGRPSEQNTGRNVHVPKPLTRLRPPLPPAQSYRGVLGPSPLAAPPTMDRGSGGRADISNKMMSLLVKCNEVVDSVKSSLGYLPYHPI